MTRFSRGRVRVREIQFIGVGPVGEPEFTLSDSTGLEPLSRFADPLVFARVVLDGAWSGVLAPSRRPVSDFHPLSAGSAILDVCRLVLLRKCEGRRQCIVVSFKFVSS